MATILVLDDDANVRRLLRAVLESSGYEVLDAAEGRAGLTLYRQRTADLVITDICMRGALIETCALVKTDDHLTLFLTLPNQAELLEMPAVAIRWVVRRHQLGVEFLKLDRHTSRKLMTASQQALPSWLEQFDWIAVGIFNLDLSATRSRFHLVTEMDPSLF